MLIGILSDTHGSLPKESRDFFKDCDEIWHAGDIGDIKILNELRDIAPTYAVYGNIDDSQIKQTTSEELFFQREGVKIYIKHIIGHPHKYQKDILTKLTEYRPDLVIAGHSHILQIIYDKKNKWLFINPGAAGKYGFHQKITLVKLKIENRKISNAQIFEKEKQ
jgi:putative phosphoesterase